MGNTSSNQTDSQDKLYKEIDFIATNYIVTQSFQDMKNLSDMNYCNDLAIMTADIIARKLNEKEVHYLAQRMKDGVEVNEMTDEKVIYTKKSDLPDLDVKNATQKRRLCIGIAKFYVKIAHLFAAIVTTINPVYIYKDSMGATVKSTLMNKADIPKGATTKIVKYNLCTSRINALMNKSDFDVPSANKVTIAPKFCDMNYDKTRKRDRNLSEEPGIPELEKLYYDEYNYDDGGFTGMSTKMRTEVYNADLLTFYRAFTGNNELPTTDAGKPTITKFSQILLRDFHKSEGCKPGGVYTQGYTATLKTKLFTDYANHLKQMMQSAASNQEGLMKVLRGDKTVDPPLEGLFENIINQENGRKEVIINPKLNSDGLQKLVVKAREIIVSLYVKCEDDFVKGLGIFEAIVEKQLKDTSEEQMEKLKETLEKSMIVEPENNSDYEEQDQNKQDNNVSEIPESVPEIPSSSAPATSTSDEKAGKPLETSEEIISALEKEIEQDKKKLELEERERAVREKEESLAKTQQGPFFSPVPVLLAPPVNNSLVSFDVAQIPDAPSVKTNEM